jgi:hypothetical protein
MTARAQPNNSSYGFRLFLHRCVGTLGETGELPPDRYLDFLCLAATQVVERKIERLIVNLPPRHLKTVAMSISLIAWELAQHPATRILVICHSDALARSIAGAVRKVLEARWFTERFATRIAKGEDRRGDFRTKQGGGLFAISTFGGVTGWGGEMIVIDDPSDIADAGSTDRLEAVNERFDTTIRNRLNNQKEGSIVVVQHRLHRRDLSGHLLEEGGWKNLALPFLADEAETITFEGEVWHRPAGNCFGPARSQPSRWTRSARPAILRPSTSSGQAG